MTREEKIQEIVDKYDVPKSIAETLLKKSTQYKRMFLNRYKRHIFRGGDDPVQAGNAIIGNGKKGTHITPQHNA